MNKSRKCMYCGIDPAEGDANVYQNGVTEWYCHEDDEGISCYERRGLLSATETVTTINLKEFM